MSHKSDSTSDLKKKLSPHKDDSQEGSEEQVTTELLDHPSYIELQSKLTKSEEEATKNFEKALRLQAEMENVLRRVERDVANAHKFALEKFVSDLLPIIDNLERAIIASTDQASDSLLEGVTLTLKLFNSVLEKYGVQEVNPERQPFNPEFHEAISAMPDKTVKPGTVLTVMQKGYLLNGRLIRPALVIVSKAE